MPTTLVLFPQRRTRGRRHNSGMAGLPTQKQHVNEHDLDGENILEPSPKCLARAMT